MHHLILLSVLGSALTASLAQAQSAATIRPVWWQSPATPTQLYVEGPSDKPQPIRVLSMCMLESFKADPVKGAVLLRREEADPADPTSKAKWIPYVTVPTPSGSKDLLMLLQPGADGKTGQARLVPLEADRLPWGSTRLVNFTPDTLIGLVDGKRFSVSPSESTVLPFVANKRAVVDMMIARESRGEQKLIFSSKGIFTPDKRTILFILRTPSGSYETRSIEEPNPNPTNEASGGLR